MPLDTLLFHTKMRALMWVRVAHDEFKVQESSWWICPSKSYHDLNKTRNVGPFWCPPRFGWVKLNVSGVTNEDVARCGRVLRDADGI